MATRLKIPAALLALIVAGTMMVRLAIAENQPHMEAALEHLRAARAELEKAEHDKGGHRARAQQLVNDAIKQVEEGIKAGNK